MRKQARVHSLKIFTHHILGTVERGTMDRLPLEVDQRRIVPVLLGDMPAIAPQRVAKKAVAVVETLSGKKVKPGVIPEEWFAWFEENMDRGVDSNELLKILVAKGFTPARNARLMQFIAAHESLTGTAWSFCVL